MGPIGGSNHSAVHRGYQDRRQLLPSARGLVQEGETLRYPMMPESCCLARGAGSESAMPAMRARFIARACKRILTSAYDHHP
jgi:hypothetical protein